VLLVITVGKRQIRLSKYVGDDSVKWDRYPPDSEESIQQLRNEYNLSFPAEYLTLLWYSNGGEGILAIENDAEINPSWIQIWPIEELVKLN
jgi:hypothetical protein